MFNRAKDQGLWNKDNPTQGIKEFKEKSRDRFLQSDELPKLFQKQNADLFSVTGTARVSTAFREGAGIITTVTDI